MMQSWLEIPSDSDFSLANVPFGICSFPYSSSTPLSATLSPCTPRCCTAIGNHAIDLHLLAEAGLLDDLVMTASGLDESGRGEIINNFHPRIVFSQPTLNEFMSCEKYVWVAVRNRLISLFLDSSSSNDDNNYSGVISADNRLQQNLALQSQCMHPLSTALYHLPASIGDYTDFYSSREHATNVGIMFRGRENALQPNWLHLPVGYHGRSSSVFPSLASSATTTVENDCCEGEVTPIAGGNRMSTVRRPCGQIQLDPLDPAKGSIYGPCKLMDFEMEVAFFVGGPTNTDNEQQQDQQGEQEQQQHRGRPLTLSEAQDRIFGYVLMNDWSARDIQKWEYVPLGPFTSKNFATTISTWVVTSMALEPFRCETSAGVQGGGGGGDPTPLEYLKDPNYGSLDVNLSVSIQPSSTSTATQICSSNLKHMYWSSAQQLVHHSVTGCPMNAGDLLASGTISGKEQHNFGSMLELSWRGSREVVLDGGEVRKFLKDGDAVIMKGWCQRDGLGRVGFGQCSGKVLPAIPFPYDSPNKKDESAVKESYTNFKLYGCGMSSCLWTVRIALAAKGIPYEYDTHAPININLDKKSQTSDEHSSTNTMQQQVPTALEFTDGDNVVRITQSLAIIELLETAFDHRGGRLLPLDPVARAKVKEITEVINSGMTQRLQYSSVLGMIDEERLREVEKLVADSRSSSGGGASVGPFATGSFGPTLADACIAPQLHNARRFGVDLESLCPTLLEVEKKFNDHPWFQNTKSKT
ncbi:hypothetical protein ACHAWT_005795 [Skeletonema menzelii]